MTKDEILAKSRLENKGKDIVDLEIQSKSRGIAGAAALTLGAILNIRGNFPIFWVMFFCYAAVLGFSNYILGRKRGNASKGVVWLLYALLMTFMTVLAVIRLFGVMKAGTV